MGTSAADIMLFLHPSFLIPKQPTMKMEGSHFGRKSGKVLVW